MMLRFFFLREIQFLYHHLLLLLKEEATTDSMVKNFYGLRGLKLNIAIAIVAGTDFALFGYDQVGGNSAQAINLLR